MLRLFILYGVLFLFGSSARAEYSAIYHQVIPYFKIRAEIEESLAENKRKAVFNSYRAFLASSDIEIDISPPYRSYGAFEESQPQPSLSHFLELPRFFRTHYGEDNFIELGLTDSYFTGPNCFNTALKFNNPNLDVRKTTRLEFLFELNKQYKLVNTNTNGKVDLEKGDIVTLWRVKKDGEYQAEHATIYLDRSFFFGKLTELGVKDPYEITTFAEQFLMYDFQLKGTVFSHIARYRFTDKQYVYTVHRLK